MKMTGIYGGYATQTELDDQYDVERVVPNIEKYLTYYVDGSAASREALKPQMRLSYGPTVAESLNLFPAQKPGKRPIFLFFHGGWWRSNPADLFDVIAMGPAAAGFVVANVNYALCPTVTITEIVRQARAAVAWIARNADRFDGDPDQIFVGGHSAGGHITGMLLLTDWVGDYGLAPDVVKGGLSISGLFDMAPFAHSWLQPALRLSGQEILNISPIRIVRECATPLIAAWGGAETTAFGIQSNDFLKAWAAKGNKGAPLEIPGKNHFDVLDGFETADGTLTKALLSLAST